MDQDQSQLSRVQSYVFEYVTGILWLLALLIALPGAANVRGSVATTVAVLRPIADLHLEIPEPIVGFLIAIAGVVLPFGISMAFRPLSLWSMNGLLRAIRLSQKHIFRQQRRDLHRSCVKRLQTILNIKSEVDYPEQLAYIASHNSGIATTLEWQRNDVVFRAASALPSALLFGAIAYRFTPLNTFGVMLVVATVFGLSAAYSIQMLARWRDRAESLIILYSNATAPSGGAKVEYPYQTPRDIGQS